MSDKKIRPELALLMTKRLIMNEIVTHARAHYEFLDKLNSIADDGDMLRDYAREFALETLRDAYDTTIANASEEDTDDAEETDDDA